MSNILFRVEAGTGVGLGHLQRCLALASALRRLGHECFFLTPGGRWAQDRVERSGFSTVATGDIEPGSEGDSRLVLDMAIRHRCDAAVVDSYLIDVSYLARLRAADLLVTVIENRVPAAGPAQLVVNGGIGVTPPSDRSSAESTQFLVGQEYALLREEFWDVPPRTARNSVREVLVTMGGADGRNLTPTVLESLDDVQGDFTVTAVTGPVASNAGEVEAAARACRRDVRLDSSPDTLRSLMLEADLAVAAGGQTLYELAATGTPAVAVQVAENQAGNVRGFARHDTATPIVFRDRESFRVALADAVARLIAQPARRHEMSQAGQCLIDGLGTQRVAEALSDMLSLAAGVER